MIRKFLISIKRKIMSVAIETRPKSNFPDHSLEEYWTQKFASDEVPLLGKCSSEPEWDWEYNWTKSAQKYAARTYNLLKEKTAKVVGTGYLQFLPATLPNPSILEDIPLDDVVACRDSEVVASLGYNDNTWKLYFDLHFCPVKEYTLSNNSVMNIILGLKYYNVPHSNASDFHKILKCEYE